MLQLLNKKHSLYAIAVVVFLFSCGPSDKKYSGNGEDLGGGMKAVADSVEIPSFKIDVRLSDRAEKKLKADSETIIVEAYFEGIPKDTTSKEFQDEGRIPIGSHKIELQRPGIANFTGVKIGRSAFDALSNKDFDILINVYSGRRSSELNMLNCDILQQPISKVLGQKHVLKGDLID